MASSSISASANPSGSRIILPGTANIRYDTSCNRLRCIRVSFRQKSKLTTIMSSEKHSHSKGPDDDDDDGKKKHGIATWKKWAVGISLSILLPSYRRKVGPLSIIMNRVNEVLETTETVTEVTEDIAVDIKKLAEAMERRIPAKDQDGKLKEALDLVEKLAEETVKATDLAQELLEKVEEAEERLDDVIEIAGAKIKKKIDEVRDKR